MNDLIAIDQIYGTSVSLKSFTVLYHCDIGHPNGTGGAVRGRFRECRTFEVRADELREIQRFKVMGCDGDHRRKISLVLIVGNVPQSRLMLLSLIFLFVWIVAANLTMCVLSRCLNVFSPENQWWL